ncbi:MAG: hypothetical protein ACT4P7_11650 [Gemmatimonadaceae bacterium]
MRTMSVPLSAALGALPLSTAPPAAHAQGTAPGTTRYYVPSMRLRPDMVNEWLDLQRKEVVPAQKKTGILTHHAGHAGRERVRVLHHHPFREVGVDGQ